MHYLINSTLENKNKKTWCTMAHLAMYTVANNSTAGQCWLIRGVNAICPQTCGEEAIRQVMAEQRQNNKGTMLISTDDRGNSGLRPAEERSSAHGTLSVNPAGFNHFCFC